MNIELKLNNETLNWKSHIQNVNTKDAKGIDILSKVRHFVPQRVLLNIYNAFVPPNILYGLLNWGNASKTDLDPRNKKCKKAVRVTFKSETEHSKPLCKYLDSLNLEDCYKLECATFMHNVNNNSSDITFEKQFRKAKDILVGYLRIYSTAKQSK